MKSKVKFIKTNKKQKVKFICKKKLKKIIQQLGWILCSIFRSKELYSQTIPHQAGILQVSCRCYKKYFIHKVGYKIVFDDKVTENV